MSVWRRIVLSLLLACLPFQTVLGATGLACSIGSHHGSPAASPARNSIQDHDPASGDTRAGHHSHGAAHEAPSAPGAHEHHGGADATAALDSAQDIGHAGSDKCRFCLECCATAAPIPAIGGTQLGPERILRVALVSVRVHATPSTDGLFRPPRA